MFKILGKLLFHFLVFSMQASFDYGTFEIKWKGETVFRGKANKFSIDRDILRGDRGNITIEFKDISSYL